MKNAVDSLNGGLVRKLHDRDSPWFRESVFVTGPLLSGESVDTGPCCAQVIHTTPLALKRFFRLCYSGGCSSERG